MRGAVGIAFKGDRGDGDHRALGKALLQLIILRLALGQALPPTIIVDHDADVIGIVEGDRAAIEGGVVEVPIWRSGAPDELGKLAPVFLITRSAAFGGEVELIPP